MLLEVISYSLRSARHHQPRRSVDARCRNIPVGPLGQLEVGARDVALRAVALATNRAATVSTRLSRSRLSRSLSPRRRVVAEGAWIVSPKANHRIACLRISQWTVLLDNGHNPMDQDNRTSFPDNGPVAACRRRRGSLPEACCRPSPHWASGRKSVAADQYCAARGGNGDKLGSLQRTTWQTAIR